MKFSFYSFDTPKGVFLGAEDENNLNMSENDKRVESFELEVAKLVGIPEDGYWSQVHTFFPQEREKKERRGDLVAVLTIAGVEEGVEAVVVGREVLGRLHEEYYGNLEGSPFERLKGAIEKIKEEGISITAASLVERAVFLAILGEGKIILKREEKLGLILRGESGGVVKTGSGYLNGGDLLLLGSRKFFDAVEGGVLKAAMENYSPQDIADSLSPVILGRGGMAEAAAVLVLAKDKKIFFPEISVKGERKLVDEKDKEKGEEFKEAVSFENSQKGKLSFNKFFPFKKFLRRRNLFVRGEEEKKKVRMYRLLGMIFLFFLGASFVFGYKRKLDEDQEKKIQRIAARVEERFNQAKSIYPEDVEKGKILIKEAQDLISEGLKIKKASFLLTDLNEKINEFLKEIGVEFELNELPVFMNLGLIEDMATGERIALAGENLLILNKERGKLYSLHREKRSFLIYGVESGEIIGGTDNKAWILSKEGIREINLSTKMSLIKIPFDERWKNIVAVGSFNNNLYLLDKGAGDIWRYLATGEGFDKGKSWFIGEKPDLFSAIDLAIDGRIWVLTKNGILKLNLGKEEVFSLKKMPEGFLDPLAIVTEVGSEDLFVLDKGRGKIYRISKEGDFRGSWYWERFKEASGLVVLDTGKKVLILIKDKVFVLEIN